MIDVFERIKTEVPILDVIQHYYSANQIKKSGHGKYFINPCPFCGGNKSGGKGGNNSFSVDAEKNLFNCFSCGVKGSAIDFVMRMKSLANPLDAAKEIDRVCSLNIDFSSNRKTNGVPPKPADPTIETRKKVFNSAATWYHKKLLKDEKALAVLKKRRKFDADFLKDRPVGYSGNRRGELLNHLRSQFKDDELLQSGLIAKSDKDGSLYEYYPPQYVIYFHIIDKQVCDFSAKHLLKHEFKKDDKRKAELYLKGEYRIGKFALYNQNDIAGEDVIFVEGQNDVEQIKRIDLRQNVVADKNMSDEDYYRRKLKRAKMVYLWYDPDKAGETYVRRWFDKFWGDFPIKVIDLGSSSGDPDEYLRSVNDPAEKLKEAKKNSVELFSFLVQRIEESDDNYTNIINLKPFTEKFSRIKDTSLVQLSIDTIKKKFKDSAVAKNVERTYKDTLQSQAASGASKKYLPYGEEEGIYLRYQGKESKVGLSNFVMRICDIILMDEVIFYRCKLINDQGEEAEDVIFNAAERSNCRRFKERCASKGAYYFTGRESDLAGIWQYEESRQHLLRTFYIQHYGWIESEKMWLFDNCAFKDGKFYEKDEEGFIRIGKRNYKSFDVLVYSGATPKLDLTSKFSKEFAQKVADSFNIVMDTKPNGKIDSYQGYLFFGFLPATLYSLEIYQKFGFFPFLFSYGPSGTGKTQVTSRLFECFGFLASPESWPGSTEPGMYQFMQQLSSLPCWRDEFKNDKTYEKLSGVLKNIYNRTGSGKGGLDNRTILQVNGTLWLSGEDNPTDEANLRRSVIFRFDPINEHKHVGYTWLTENRRNLSILTREIIVRKTPERVEEYLKLADEIARYIMDNSEESVDFGTAMNHAIPAAGAYIMGIDLPGDFITYVMYHAQKGYAHRLTESPIYQFFSELSFIYNRYDVLNRSVKYDSAQNTLAIHFPSAIKIIQKELRSRNEHLKIKADSVKDYLKDLDACISINKRVYMQKGFHPQCLVFDLSKLPDNIRDIAEFGEKEEF